MQSLGCAIAIGCIIFHFLNLNVGSIHRMDWGHIQRPWKAPTWLIWLITTALNVPPNFTLELRAKGFKIGRGLEAIPIPRCSMPWVRAVAAA